MSASTLLLAPGAHPPVAIDGGVDDALDAAVALGPYDDPAVAQRHAAAQQLGAVGDGVAQQADVAARGGAPGAARSRGPGGGPASSASTTFAP